MNIAIATPCLVEGDAVGNDVVGMYKTLKKDGHQVYLFAEKASVSTPTEHINSISSYDMDLYIYHHSIYCEAGVKALENLKCKKVVKYHNITPPKFFHPKSQTADQCQRGLDQLKHMAEINPFWWADSEFNRLQLEEYIKTECEIIPPFNQVEDMFSIEPNYKRVEEINDWNENILVVGRVAPNKNLTLALEAFSYYQEFRKESRIIFVGDDKTDYARNLHYKINELKLHNKVKFAGKVTLEELRSFYMMADALLITSNHEGFCVPLVEAMGMRVPVVSVKKCALPYTGGDAICYVNDDPKNIATGINEVMKDRKKYIAAGWQRYSDNFQNSIVSMMLSKSVNAILMK